MNEKITANTANFCSLQVSGLRKKTNRAESFLLRILVYISAILSLSVLIFLVIYILVMGIPHITGKLFSLTYTSENLSFVPAFFNTLIIGLLTLLLAVPLGVGAAIYMNEYASSTNRLVPIVRMTAETLAGIPSIVYGLFGYLLFVVALRWSYSLLAGICTMAIMVLPIIMRTSEEALKAVPDAYREGSFGLGAGRLRTVFSIVLPAAVPGIFSGIVLSAGRIVGETAALIYTAGTVASVPSSLMGSGRTLSVHLYALWVEGLSSDQSYAAAVMLLVLVVILNALSSWIAGKAAVSHG